MQVVAWWINRPTRPQAEEVLIIFTSDVRTSVTNVSPDKKTDTMCENNDHLT